MSRKCKVDAGKGVLAGHHVSHSNRKTKRRFLPNLQIISFLSELLGKKVSLRVTAGTIRTIEHNEGLDNFLLTTKSAKLTDEARKLKKAVKKASELKAAAA